MLKTTDKKKNLIIFRRKEKREKKQTAWLEAVNQIIITTTEGVKKNDSWKSWSEIKAHRFAFFTGKTLAVYLVQITFFLFKITKRQKTKISSQYWFMTLKRQKYEMKFNLKFSTLKVTKNIFFLCNNFWWTKIGGRTVTGGVREWGVRENGEN